METTTLTVVIEQRLRASRRAGELHNRALRERRELTHAESMEFDAAMREARERKEAARRLSRNQ